MRVTDRGAGIPKAELKRIFKRFYRVPGPLATRVKGTGLGTVHRALGGASATAAGPGRKAKAWGGAAHSVLQLPVAKTR